jgi:hypothetical protein
MSARGQELWRWPLWSWKHLALTCAVLAVVLIGLGRLQAHGEESKASGPGPTLSTTVGPTEPALASATRAVERVPSSLSASASSTPSRATTGPVEVARAFVTAWARPYDRASEWRARVMPMATPQFAAQLSRTDPLRVPATAVVGNGVEVSKSATSVTNRHTTDNGRVLVTLTRSGAHWLVADIAPDESIGGVP